MGRASKEIAYQNNATDTHPFHSNPSKYTGLLQYNEVNNSATLYDYVTQPSVHVGLTKFGNITLGYANTGLITPGEQPEFASFFTLRAYREELYVIDTPTSSLLFSLKAVYGNEINTVPRLRRSNWRSRP